AVLTGRAPGARPAPATAGPAARAATTAAAAGPPPAPGHRRPPRWRAGGPVSGSASHQRPGSLRWSADPVGAGCGQRDVVDRLAIHRRYGVRVIFSAASG